MKFTAKTIANFLQGEVVGNPDVEVFDVAKIEEGREGALSFLANPKYEQYIYTTQSSVVLVNADFTPTAPIQTTLIKVPSAYQAFAALLDMYQQAKPQKMGIDKEAFISTDAQIGKDVYIGAFAYIGSNVVIGNNSKIYPQAYIGDNATIGDNTIVYAGVKIYTECKIGANCVIHAGAVIGADGFGFAPNSENNYKKIAQIGNVVIEDYVEIGANTCIDRATMGSTIIRKGVKLDNLIQIAHNDEIGENTVMAAQCGISGSTKIGANCMFGGQTGIAGHLTIAQGTKMGGQSGVNSSVLTENIAFMGSPIIPASDFYKSSVLFRKLPDIYKQINQLEREIKELKQRL